MNDISHPTPRDQDFIEIDIDENDMVVLTKKTGPLMPVEDFAEVYRRLGFTIIRRGRVLLMAKPQESEASE